MTTPGITTGSPVPNYVDAHAGVAMIDGRLLRGDEAMIQITDEGFLRGDGAFELVRLFSGHSFALEEHLARLGRSAQALRLPYDAAALADELGELLKGLGDHDGAVRVIVTRAGRRIAIAEAMPKAMPATLALATFEYEAIGVMRGVKSLSYAPNMLLRRLAQAEGADDALLITPTGCVLEAPTASFFYVLEDELYTPPLSAGILDSITRRHLLAVVGGAERQTTREDLSRIEEAFLASTLEEVHPVHRIDDHHLTGSPGPHAKAIGRQIRAHVAENLDRL